MFGGFASKDNLGTFALCIVDMLKDFLNRSCIDKRTLTGLRVQTKAELELRNFLLKQFGKFVVNFLMHKEAVGAIIR